MKKLLIGFLVLVVVLVVAVLVVPLLIPTDTYKNEITSRIQEATGREVTINGDFSLQLIPSIAFTANDVTFANAEGAQAEHMAQLDALDVEVKLVPLISGNIEIDRLVLVRPTVNLEVDRNGNPNWAFDTQAAQGNRTANDRPGQQQAASAEGSPLPAGLRLGDIRIEDGVIRYRNAQSGESYEVTDATITVSLPDLQSAFETNGSFTYNGKQVEFQARADEPAKLVTADGSPFSLTVSGEPLALSFDGHASMAEAPAASGTVELNVPSLRNLAAWTGSPLPDDGSNTLQNFAVSGSLDMRGDRIALGDARIRFDDIEARGTIALSTGGDVPTVTGELNVDTLDMTPYLVEPTSNGGANETSENQSSGGEQQAATRSEGWSTEPIDTAALRQVNAELSVSAGGIKVRDIEIGQSSLNVMLNGGKLTFDLSETNLYDGRGSARIMIDGSGEVPSLTVTGVALTGFKAEPFLRDAAGYERLSGTANIALPYLSGRGRSLQEIMSSLTTRRGGEQVSGRFEFKDGALKGMNVAALVRHAGTLFTDSAALESKDTDFTSINGTFTVTDGVLNNGDLVMISPLLRVSGAGDANIGQQTLEYRLEPRAVLSIEGQGGRRDLGGMVVPVVCTGPWPSVNCRPDVTGLRLVGTDGELRLPTPDAIQNLPGQLQERLPQGLRERLAPGTGNGEQEGAAGNIRRQLERALPGQRQQDGQEQDQQQQQQEDQEQSREGNIGRRLQQFLPRGREEGQQQ